MRGQEQTDALSAKLSTTSDQNLSKASAELAGYERVLKTLKAGDELTPVMERRVSETKMLITGLEAAMAPKSPK